jgi:hypothetical protein
MVYRNRSGGGDPHWLIARFAGKCAKCGAGISTGDRVFYYPNGRAAYSGKCAEAAAADFSAAAADERAYGSAS